MVTNAQIMVYVDVEMTKNLDTEMDTIAVLLLMSHALRKVMMSNVQREKVFCGIPFVNTRDSVPFLFIVGQLYQATAAL